MRRALPGLHAVTGWDSVGAFFRRGKIKGFWKLQTKGSFYLQPCTCIKNKLKMFARNYFLRLFNFSNKA